MIIQFVNSNLNKQAEITQGTTQRANIIDIMTQEKRDCYSHLCITMDLRMHVKWITVGDVRMCVRICNREKYKGMKREAFR